MRSETLPRTLPNQMAECTACCNTGRLNHRRERLLLTAFENCRRIRGNYREMLKLYDALNYHDDVQKVYANFDIDESEME
jgi:transcriptional/translational regulatory protein YebC/TACO1